MSFRSKFRQFVKWTKGHQDTNQEFLNTDAPKDTGDSNSWTSGENQINDETAKGYAIWVADWYFGWLDAKTGNSNSAAAKPIVTNNADVDGFLLTGIVGVVVYFVIKKIFL